MCMIRTLQGTHAIRVVGRVGGDRIVAGFDLPTVWQIQGGV
jgi:hypothetical protein